MSEAINLYESDRIYELNIGASFQNSSNTSYHNFKCELNRNEKLNKFKLLNFFPILR
jgi:hypothetical protein